MPISKNKDRPLTQKQQAFVDNWDGDGVEACRKAGYKPDNDSALSVVNNRLLKNVKICKAIDAKKAAAALPCIMNRQQRQKVLTEMINDPKLSAKDKRGAIDILNKMDGEYIQKVEMSGQLDTTQRVTIYVPHNNREVSKDDKQED